MSRRRRRLRKDPGVESSRMNKCQTLDTLPIEVLVEILSYLSKEQRLTVSKMSRRLREASHHPKFLDKFVRSANLDTSRSILKLRSDLKGAPAQYLNKFSCDLHLVDEFQVSSFSKMLKDFTSLKSLQIDVAAHHCQTHYEIVIPDTVEHFVFMGGDRKRINFWTNLSFSTKRGFTDLHLLIFRHRHLSEISIIYMSRKTLRSMCITDYSLTKESLELICMCTNLQALCFDTQQGGIVKTDGMGSYLCLLTKLQILVVYRMDLSVLKALLQLDGVQQLLQLKALVFKLKKNTYKSEEFIIEDKHLLEVIGSRFPNLELLNFDYGRTLHPRQFLLNFIMKSRQLKYISSCQLVVDDYSNNLAVQQIIKERKITILRFERNVWLDNFSALDFYDHKNSYILSSWTFRLLDDQEEIVEPTCFELKHN